MEATIDITCRPITPAVGAVIEGVDVSRPLPPAVLKTVRQALRDHGVVFFRGQDKLTLEGLGEFLDQIAPVNPDPVLGKPMEGNISYGKSATAVWHADHTFYEDPPIYTALRSVKLPPLGGDTCWASMYAAYEALSEPIRKMLDGLTALHSMETTIERFPGVREHFNEWAKVHSYEAVHPVVIVHPETGRKALFVSELGTLKILEVSATESRHLLTMLFDHMKSPRFSMRWTWKPNDVVVWDNRPLQHFAVPDYDTERVMQAVRTIGQRPVGIRG